jgi:hypothetical protein
VRVFARNDGGHGREMGNACRGFPLADRGTQVLAALAVGELWPLAS